MQFLPVLVKEQKPEELQAYYFTHIYGISTVGTSFHAWRALPNETVEPFDDGIGHVDIDTRDGTMIWNSLMPSVRLIRELSLVSSSLHTTPTPQHSLCTPSTWDTIRESRVMTSVLHLQDAYSGLGLLHCRTITDLASDVTRGPRLPGMEEIEQRGCNPTLLSDQAHALPSTCVNVPMGRGVHIGNIGVVGVEGEGNK